MTESVIDLSLGWPSPCLHPTSILSQACQALLADQAASTPALLYGPDPGPSELLEPLAAFLSQFYSTPWTSPSRLTITGGASQSLACILQVFSDPSYTEGVYMIAPTYFLACRMFEDNGFAGRLKAVPEDDEGIDVEYLEALLCQKPGAEASKRERPLYKQPSRQQKVYRNIIYCVPTFSNPSGKTMSLQRRQQLVRLARQYDALIISDDVYDFLPWNAPSASETKMPRLVDVDHALDGGVSSPFGNVVSNGSFSKILGPGLRTGWTESTELFAAGLSECGSTRSGGSASQFTACAIAKILQSGAFQDHATTCLLPALQNRSTIMIQAVQKYLLPLGATLDPRACLGGYYLYVQLPEPIRVKDFASLAYEREHVIIGSGDTFEVHGDEHSVPVQATMRLCIAWEDEDRLVAGVFRLSKVLAHMSHQDCATRRALL